MMKRALFFLLLLFWEPSFAESFFQKVGISQGGTKQNIKRIVVFYPNPFLGDNLVPLSIVEAFDKQLKQAHPDGNYEVVYVSPVANKILKSTDHVKAVTFSTEQYLSDERAKHFYDEVLKPYIDSNTLLYQGSDIEMLSHYDNHKFDEHKDYEKIEDNKRLAGRLSLDVRKNIEEALSGGTLGGTLKKSQRQWHLYIPDKKDEKGGYTLSSEAYSKDTPFTGYDHGHNYAALIDPQIGATISSSYLPDSAPREDLRLLLQKQGLDPQREFILLNYNSGPDKTSHAEYISRYMGGLIELILKKYPSANIVMSSPQDYDMGEVEKLAYEKAIQDLNKKVELANKEKKRVAIIPHNNFPLLSRAIEDSKLVLTKETGLVHFANIRKSVALDPGSAPKVIAFSPTEFDATKFNWQIRSQPLIQYASLKEGDPNFTRLSEALEAGMSGSPFVPYRVHQEYSGLLDYQLEDPLEHARRVQSSYEIMETLKQRYDHPSTGEKLWDKDSIRVFEEALARFVHPNTNYANTDFISYYRDLIDWLYDHYHAEIPKLNQREVRDLAHIAQSIYGKILLSWWKLKESPNFSEKDFPHLGDEFWKKLFALSEKSYNYDVLGNLLKEVPLNELPSLKLMKSYFSQPPKGLWHEAFLERLENGVKRRIENLNCETIFVPLNRVP